MNLRNLSIIHTEGFQISRIVRRIAMKSIVKVNQTYRIGITQSIKPESMLIMKYIHYH